MSKNVTASHTAGLDLTISDQTMTVDYTYENGVLTGAKGSGSMRTEDVFENVTAGTITQEYKIVQGQAKLSRNISQTWSVNKKKEGEATYETPGENMDGSTSKQIMVVEYQYEENVGKGIKTGRLVGASGSGKSESNDGWGNFNVAGITQTYDKKYIDQFGKALLTETISVSESKHKDELGHLIDGSIDGSSSRQEMKVSYTYDEKGKMATASGSGNSESNDGFGNITKSEITQKYDKNAIQELGKALLSESYTVSNSFHKDEKGNLVEHNLDGTFSEQRMSVFYAYDDKGMMVESGGKYGGNGTGSTTYGTGSFTSGDEFGSATIGTVEQTYKIYGGQAKILTSTSKSSTVNADGSKSWSDGSSQWFDKNHDGVRQDDEMVTTTPMTIEYEYHDSGRLKGAKTKSHGFTVSDDGFGNRTLTEVEQTFTDPVLTGGAAKVLTSTSKTHTSNIDGSWNMMNGDSVLFDGEMTQTVALTITYRYDVFDRIGRLMGAESNKGVSISNDGFGNQTLSVMKQIFTDPEKTGGQTKLALSDTSSYTKNLDGSWSAMGVEALPSSVKEAMNKEVTDAQAEVGTARSEYRSSAGSISDIQFLKNQISSAEEDYAGAVKGINEQYDIAVAEADKKLSMEQGGAQGVFDDYVKKMQSEKETKIVAALKIYTDVTSAAREEGRKIDNELSGSYNELTKKDSVLDKSIASAIQSIDALPDTNALSQSFINNLLSGQVQTELTQNFVGSVWTKVFGSVIKVLSKEYPIDNSEWENLQKDMQAEIGDYVKNYGLAKNDFVKGYSKSVGEYVKKVSSLIGTYNSILADKGPGPANRYWRAKAKKAVDEAFGALKGDLKSLYNNYISAQQLNAVNYMFKSSGVFGKWLDVVRGNGQVKGKAQIIYDQAVKKIGSDFDVLVAKAKLDMESKKSYFASAHKNDMSRLAAVRDGKIKPAETARDQKVAALEKGIASLRAKLSLAQSKLSAAKARVKAAESRQEEINSSESLKVRYNYDKNGRLKSDANGFVATATGRSVSYDGFGATTISVLRQNFTEVNGQAKLKENITTSKTTNLDGSYTLMGMPDENGIVQGSALKITYHYYGEDGYDPNTSDRKIGTVASAEGLGGSYANDGFGNISVSEMKQTYEAVKGQAKLKISETASYTQSIDGSWSVMGLIPPNLLNGLKGAEEEYASVLEETKSGRGPPDAAKLAAAKEKMDSLKSLVSSLQGSESLTVTYEYDTEGTGKLLSGEGNQAAAHGRGKSVSNDGFGNIATSTIDQEFKSILGQAKLRYSTNGSHTVNVDGSESWMDGSTQKINGANVLTAAITITYNYDDKIGGTGALLSATATEGLSISDDGFGNRAQTTVHQEFEVSKATLGQAKLNKSFSKTDSYNLDGSSSHQEITVNYTYLNGVLNTAVGSGTMSSNDGFDNL
ncbi:MAG: hypothetical protein HYY63_02260, partial [Elusimicrobia bacterium]|nr:hypothetical protein [Elusimicrobiota bacterium]